MLRGELHGWRDNTRTRTPRSGAASLNAAKQLRITQHLGVEIERRACFSHEREKFFRALVGLTTRGPGSGSAPLVQSASKSAAAV